jgi:Holliday junction resolvase RusA-like endonuclease
MSKIILNINPIPAPRMTRSDKWKLDPNHKDPMRRQRVCVANYFAYKNEIIWTCKKNNYTLQPVLYIIFNIPVPEYKKNKIKIGDPHMQKPDVDNLVKGFMDSFGKDDGFVWNLCAVKRWAEKGSIEIIL